LPVSWLADDLVQGNDGLAPGAKDHHAPDRTQSWLLLGRKSSGSSAANSSDIKEQYSRETDVARQLGVFGSPNIHGRPENLLGR
jgi:hypothetical protein